MEDDMRAKILLAAIAVMAALSGWATTAAADGYYRQGYYSYPDRNYTYYIYPDRGYTYYYSYPDRSYTYYYNDPYYGGYGDPHRNYFNQYSSNRYDPYGIENHDTN
jgi:hypothetical protein